MAYALVGQFKSTDSAASASTSLTRTPSAGAGAFLIVSYQNGAAPLTVVSLQNQAAASIAFTQATFTSWNQGAAAGFAQLILWVPSFPGGTTSITLTMSAAPSGGNLYFQQCEYTGLSTSLTIDAQTGQTQNGPGAGTDAVTSGLATPSGVVTAGGAICFAFSGSYSAFESNAAGTGFGNYLAINPAPGSDGAGAVEDKRITTNSSVAGTFTAATGGNTYSTQVIIIDEFFIPGPVATVAWIT